LNTALYVIDFKGNDPRFISYFLRAHLKNYKSEKAAVPGVDRKVLHKLPAKCPDTQIQQSIVRVLSAYDDLIENNRRRIGLLEEAARQLYKEWFVRLRFPGHEHVKIVDGVPEGWELLTLRDVATLNYGKALKEETRIPGDIPVYGSSGIVGSHNKALVVGPGIILGRKGNVGSVRWSHSDFFPIDTVYFINSEQSDFHLYLTLQHMHFLSTDVAVPGLNRDFAYSRLLIRPSATVAERFEDEVTPIFLQVQKLVDWNASLAKARDLLLPRLMNGTIPV
jgi:type I restriction enzyme S subunit